MRNAKLGVVPTVVLNGERARRTARRSLVEMQNV
jgi:hypothetical protein